MADDLPTWVTTAGALGMVIGTTILAVWQGKKGKPETPGSEAQVIAGVIANPQAVADLASSIRNADGTMRELVELMSEERDRRKLEIAVREEIDRREDHDRKGMRR